MQHGRISGRNVASQRVDSGHSIIDGFIGVLFEIGTAAVGVTTYLKARLLNQLADADDAIEGEDVIFLEQFGFDPVGLIHCLVGVFAHLAAAGFAGIDCLAHVLERLAIVASGLNLDIQQLQVLGGSQQVSGGLQCGVELIECTSDLRCSLCVVQHLVAHTVDAQLKGQLIDLRNRSDTVPTIDQRLIAEPAGGRNHQRHQQHQAKADRQFEADTRIGEAFG